MKIKIELKENSLVLLQELSQIHKEVSISMVASWLLEQLAEETNVQLKRSSILLNNLRRLNE